jgi:hypothetical protein
MDGCFYCDIGRYANFHFSFVESWYLIEWELLLLSHDWQIVVFIIDGFIVESVKIGQSAIFNGWMFLLWYWSLCEFLFFVCRKLVSDFICKSLRLVLWAIALVPLNQANWQFLMDDMFQNIDISNIYRTNEMIHIILLVLLCNHPCPTYTLLQLSHL